jgi:hypothetical protein
LQGLTDFTAEAGFGAAQEGQVAGLLVQGAVAGGEALVCVEILVTGRLFAHGLFYGDGFEEPGPVETPRGVYELVDEYLGDSGLGRELREKSLLEGFEFPRVFVGEQDQIGAEAVFDGVHGGTLLAVGGFGTAEGAVPSCGFDFSN